METKRFLVNDDIYDFVDTIPHSRYNSSLFFTKIKLCKKTKYKNIQQREFYRIKEKGHRETFKVNTTKIDKKRYKRAKRKRIGSIIKKENTLFEIEGKRFTLQNYQKPNDKLKVLTFYLAEQEDQTLPKILEKYIIKEITDSQRYCDANIVLQQESLPKNYEIYKIFSEIKNQNKMSDLIKPNFFYADAVRVLLYRQMQNILNMRANLLDKAFINSKDLQSYKSYLYQNLTLLKSFKDLLSKSLYKSIYPYIKKLYRQSKELDHLYNIYEQINSLDFILSSDEIDKLQKVIQQKISQTSHNILHQLQTREFNIIFDQYQLLLKEKNNIQISKQNLTIDKYLKKRLKEAYKKLKKRLKKYEDCNDIYSYKRIKRAVFKLSTFIKLTKEGTNKNLSKPTALLDALYHDLEEYNDISKISLMQISYIKHSQNDTITKNRAVNRIILNRENAYNRLKSVINKKSHKLLKSSANIF